MNHANLFKYTYVDLKRVMQIYLNICRLKKGYANLCKFKVLCKFMKMYINLKRISQVETRDSVVLTTAVAVFIVVGEAKGNAAAVVMTAAVLKV